MFCPQCGNQNADDAVHCSRCGRELRSTAPIAGTVIPPGYSGNVPNYLVPAILVTVLCCLPCGIAAIVYAAQVNSKLSAGDIAGAQAASKNAKMWCWISAGAGIAVGILYACFVVFIGLANHH